MLRRFLALLAGFVLFNVVVIASELVGGRFYPMPAVDLRDKVAVKAAVSGMPVIALVLVLLGWAVASFAGAYLTARIARSRTPAIVLGFVATVIGIVNNLSVPPPAWFWAVSLFAFVPPALLAARVAIRTT